MKPILSKLLPALVGLILGAGGLLGATVAFGGSLPFVPQKESVAAVATPAPEATGVLYPTRERIVNLADTGILRYLKTTIVLEVFDPENPTGAVKSAETKGKEELPKDLKPKAVVIEDKITAILSAKTATELMTAAGKQHLKQELREGLNQTLHEDRILGVFFTDFIIQ